MKQAPMRVVRHFIIDGKEYLEDEVAPEMRKQIFEELACRAMETVGAERVKEKGTA